MNCERISGSFLHWNVFVPHLTIHETIVANQGAFHPIDLLLTGLHYATFTITRISFNPLISQMLIINVTTEINGSTIYCSEDGNKNGAPMLTFLITNGVKLNCNSINLLFSNLPQTALSMLPW